MKKQILFIDDEPHFRDGLQRMLRPQQPVWQMNFVSSVDEALESIEEVAYDAIVSDVLMPGKDGFALLDILRRSEKTKDIPVIILTGGNDDELKRRALEMEAADLLSKPVKAEDLQARLKSILRLKAYQDEIKQKNLTLERMVRERTAELEESRLDIVLRLSKAAEYRDEETSDHILRVGCYCRGLAEELKMDRDFSEMIFLASPMHDIGKIGIPDMILLKPGKLTADERKIMERHCIIGHEILMQEPEGLKPFLQWHRDRSALGRLKDPLIEMAAQITLGHHEKWDGSGYPQGKKGAEIPLPARITALVDVYDALRTVRPYKPALSEEATLEIMRKEAAAHFDRQIFSAFEKITDIFNSIHHQFSEAPLAPAMAEMR